MGLPPLICTKYPLFTITTLLSKSQEKMDWFHSKTRSNGLKVENMDFRQEVEPRNALQLICVQVRKNKLSTYLFPYFFLMYIMQNQNLRISPSFRFFVWFFATYFC